MIVFYHNADLDGKCSAALLKSRYPGERFIGINYGDKFPWDEVKDESVVMVDFSLQPFSDMVRLRKEAANLVWIDHHKAAFADMEDYHHTTGDFSPWYGIRDTKYAACELTWSYYFDCQDWVDPSKMPTWVRLLGRWDVWDHTDELVVPFQYGMRSLNTDIYESVWDDLLRERYTFQVGLTVQSIIDRGKIILNYEDEGNAAYARATAYEATFDGHLVIVINRALCGSRTFKSVYDPLQHDFMVAWVRRPDCYSVRMYSDSGKVDLSEIARKHGGGGHYGAAGFQCKELPPELLLLPVTNK